MHPIVINIVFGMLVWIECVLTIDAVEANVGTVTSAVGELSYLALRVGSGTVYNG